MLDGWAGHQPGWFEAVETELRGRMVEIERDATAEIVAATTSARR